MKSLIFRVLTRVLSPVLLLVAFWIFVRGHNAPGGGFIAGLIAASAMILRILSDGWNSLPRRLSENLFGLAGIGLLLCMLSGLVGMTIQNPFMTGRWIRPGGIEIGTPQLFDLGVLLIVFAIVTIAAGMLIREDEGESA